MSEKIERPATDPRPFTAGEFPEEPALECDIVMKGGITSGVIYPLAVCQLATTYRLHSVGGASAGAIAAAAAAAAELGRTTGASAAVPGATLPPGFLGLAKFPDLLTEEQDDGRSLLFHLFRPQPETERLFELLTAGMDEASRLPKPVTAKPVITMVARLLAKAASRARRQVLIGIVPGLIITALGIVGLIATLSAYGIGLSILTILLGLAISLLGFVIAVVASALGDVLGLADVGFGITSGRGATDDDPALTPWLHGRLQELAGRSAADEPLTFGDLKQKDITFQVMTTNLSRRQPMSMPWKENTYFFDPDEFAKLFGETIKNWMVEHPPPLPTAPSARRRRELVLSHAGDLRPWPAPDDLPIIVATRMSLSFPVLISAVPLYSIDWNISTNRAYRDEVREKEQTLVDGRIAGVEERPRFDVNWFSDGGLTANLPVHFFDAALPTRPTFAFDLADFTDDRPRNEDEWENSYLPTRNQGGLHRRTDRWDATKPVSHLLSFAWSLIDTARIWSDEAALVMPGYRDRVVTVYQGGDEGGLNLSMKKETVDDLSLRGRFAAQKLIHRFSDAGGGWKNHRWLRFRSATASLNEWLAGFEQGYTAPSQHSYGNMLDDSDNQPSYPIEGSRLTAARERTESLRAEIADWLANPADAVTNGRPKQTPVLRLVPRTEAERNDGAS